MISKAKVIIHIQITNKVSEKCVHVYYSRNTELIQDELRSRIHLWGITAIHHNMITIGIYLVTTIKIILTEKDQLLTTLNVKGWKLNL